MSSSETFISSAGFRYLKLNAAALATAVVAYAAHSPLGGAAGDTTLGYTLGILSAAGILYLTWFGIRKRSYRAHRTTLKECLAAHVWLGILLIFLVPLHSGFQFGVNVHTLAYVVMLLVVASGIFGAYVYVRYAPEIGSHRGQGSVALLLEQIALLSRELHKLGHNKSDRFLGLISSLDLRETPAIVSKRPPDLSSARVAAQIQELADEEQADAIKAVSLLQKKHNLASAASREGWVKLLIRGWLYLHIPLTALLLVTLFVHVFSVLYYR